MKKEDYVKFSITWGLAFKMASSNKPDNETIMAAFDLILDRTIDEVVCAIKLHSATSSYPPTPAAIIKLLRIDNPHLSADEAWSICPSSENDTVVWTREMCEAFGMASKILENGDKIAARMAFKGCYERLVSVAHLKNRDPVWSVSIGFDKDEAITAIENAVRLGRIDENTAKKLLPGPSESGYIGKLLTGKTVVTNDKDALKNIKKIKDIIKKSNAQDDE